MKKKVCNWIDSNQWGGLQLVNRGISPCCSRPITILTESETEYTTITAEKIQTARRNLYEGINDGSYHECDGCALLVEKDENDIDIGKLDFLTMAPFKTCNLRCKYCYYTHDELGEKLLEKHKYILPIVKNFHENNLLKENFVLGLAGGESTLAEDIPETLQFISKHYKNPGFMLQSNSSINTKTANIIKCLKNLPNINNILYTSLDAGTPETYKDIRGKDLFYDVINNLYNYAINATFNEMQLKYILLDDKEKNANNLSDENIFGFCNIVKFIAENNQNKTTVILDKDLFKVDEPIDDVMLSAAGKLMYCTENILGLEIQFIGGGLAHHSFVGQEDIKRIRKFASEYKNAEKTAKEKYYLNLLTSKSKPIKTDSISQEQMFCYIENKLDSIREKIEKPTLLQKIFSVTNEGSHKVVRILGIKAKFKKVSLLNGLKNRIHNLFWSRKCILCGSTKLERYRTSINTFLLERMFGKNPPRWIKTDLLLCQECSLRYFELRPNEKQIAQIYKDYRSDDYQKQREKHDVYYTPEFNYNLGHNEEALIFRKENLARNLQEHADISSIKKVLDYGGDEGQFIPEILNNAERFVYEVSGVKPIEGVKVISNENELKNHQWDFVMCCHVLEHISYPAEFLKELVSLVKPGGYLYIEVPEEGMNISDYAIQSNLRGLLRRPRRLFEILSQRYLQNDSVSVYPQMHEHINFFEVKTLEQIFTGSEYKILNTQQKPGLISILIKRQEQK